MGGHAGTSWPGLPMPTADFVLPGLSPGFIGVVAVREQLSIASVPDWLCSALGLLSKLSKSPQNR